MAASLTPCFSNRGIALCSWTSCPLQNGHQSAERKKRRTVPFVPFKLSRVCISPNWSRAEKAGAFWPTASPIDIESSPDGHRVSQVSAYRCLRLNAVHDPVRIVIQQQLRTRHIFGALGGFGKGFVCVAAARHQDAGPRSGLCGVLSSHCEWSYRKKRHHIEEEALTQRISSGRQHQCASCLDRRAWYA